MGNNEQILLTLGISVGPALTNLERELSNFEKTRSLKFNVDSRGIIGANTVLSEFDKTLERVNRHFLSWGAAAATIGLLSRGIEDTVKSFIKLDSSLQRININLNTSAANLQKFGNSLFQVARDTGQSIDEVTKAAAIFAQQGNNTVETVKKTSAALLLMRQSGLDLEDSVEAITATMQEFKKESLSAIDVANKFASVEGKFAVSSKTLAEAFTRVGASAEAAGVSSNQLVAIITSIASATQASGPRIATFLNTLFNNENKQQTIEQFKNLGIQVEKVPGQFLPAVQVIQNISTKYKEFSGATGQANDALKQQIVQLVGGSRNLNLLNALLNDVTKSNGIYAQSLGVVTNAQDAAIQKNNELNKSFSAQANATVQTLTQVAAAVGKLTLSPVFDRTIGNFNSLTKLLGNNQGSQAEQLGKNLGEGILKGIGNAIAGPGLVIGGVILAKLVGQVSKYALEAGRGLLANNSAAEQQQSLQQAINSALKQQGLTYQDILSLGKNRISQEQFILDLLKQQSAAQIGGSALSNSFTSSLFDRGVRANGLTISTRAQGYLPNEVLSAISNEQSATSQNVGGAAGANPVVVSNFSIGGVPQTIVANDKEFIVPTTSINPSYNGPDRMSIVNPQMISSLGGLPSGAIPIHAKGFVPKNFALGDIPYEALSTFLGNQGLDYLSSNFNSVIGGLGGLGAGAGIGGILKHFLQGSGESSDLNFRSNFSPNGGGLSIKNTLDKNEFLYDNPDNILNDSTNSKLQFNDEDLTYLSGEESGQINNKRSRAAELRQIKKLGLIGSNRVKSRKRRGLLLEAKRLGLGNLEDLNKSEIANLININKLSNAPELAQYGLQHRGFGLGENVENNFNVLRKIGFRADGYVPNAAIGFGDLIGSGFSREVFDAGDNVLSRPKTKQQIIKGLKNTYHSGKILDILLQPEHLSSIVDESRGLRVLQQIAGEKLGGPKIRRIGKRGSFIAEKINEPTLREIRNNGLGNTLDLRSKYQFNLADRGLEDRDHNDDNLAGNINTGYIRPLDFGELYSAGGKGIEGKIEAIRKLSHGDGNLRAKLNLASKKLGLGLSFASGYIPEGYSEEDFNKLSTQQKIKALEIEDKIVGKEIEYHKIEKFKNSPRLKINNLLNKLTGGLAGNLGIEDIVQYLNQNSENEVPVSSGNIEQSAVKTARIKKVSNNPEQISLVRQARALGIPGIRDDFKVKTLQDKISKELNVGKAPASGSIPPLPPSIPGLSSPSDEPELPRKSKKNIRIGRSYLEEEAKKRLIDLSDNPSDLALRQKIIDVDENFYKQKTPQAVIDFGQPTALQAGLKSAPSQLFNRSNVNVLNKNSTRALDIDGPKLKENIRKEFERTNKLSGNPLNSQEITNLVETELAKKAAYYINKQQEDLSKIGTNKQSLKSKIESLTNQSQGSQIGVQIENSVVRGDNLSAPLKKAFLAQTKKKLLDQFDPQSRSNPQVQNLVNQLAQSELGVVTGQIGQVQNDRAKNNNNADFTNSFINKYSGFFGGANGKGAKSEIEEFVQKQVGLGANENEVRNQIKNLQSESGQRASSIRAQRGLNIAFTAPILSSLATSALGNGVSDSTKNTINGVTNSLSAGGTIAAVGGFNPISLTIAGVVTSFGLLKTSIDALTPSVDDVEKSFETSLTKRQDTSQGIEAFLRAKEQVNDLIESGGSNRDIEKAKLIEEQNLQNINDPDTRKKLASSTVDQGYDIQNNFSQDTLKLAQQKNIQTDLLKFNQYNSPFAIGTRSFNSSILGAKPANKFSGPDDSFLIKSASDFAAANTYVGANNALSKGIEGLTKEDVKLLIKQIVEDENSQKSDKETGKSNQSDQFLNFNKDIASIINQGVFQKVFSAQGSFNTQSNRINRLGGLIEESADTLNPLSILNSKNSLALAGIQNQTGLESTKALGGGLDQLNNIFSNKQLDRGSPELVQLAQSTIGGIKSGELFGDKAIEALQKISDASGNAGIQEDIKKILQDSQEKLATIGQNTQNEIEKQNTANDLAQRILQTQTQRNFAGGLETFLNPSKFNDISSPIGSGLGSLINRDIFNQPLNAAERGFQSASPQERALVNQQTNVTNANFGRSNIELSQALSNLAGGDPAILNKINKLVGGPDQLGSDISSGRSSQFASLGRNALEGLNGLHGDFDFSISRLQREVGTGANSLNFDKVLGDLGNLRGRAGDKQDQQKFEKVFSLFDILNNEIKKTPAASREQANTILKSDELPEDLRKLQQTILDSQNKDQTLIDKTTEQITSLDSLNATLQKLNGLTPSNSGANPAINGNNPTITNNASINLPSIQSSFRPRLTLTGIANANFNARKQSNDENGFVNTLTSLQGTSLHQSDLYSLYQKRDTINQQLQKKDGGSLSGSDRILSDKISSLLQHLQDNVKKDTTTGNDSKVGVDAKVNVAVNVAGQLNNDKNLDGLGDLIKQYILTLVQPGAINKGAPPNAAALS